MGQHTIEYRGDKKSSETVLLYKVQQKWDLWSVGVIGPGGFWRVRHGSDVYSWRKKFRWRSSGMKREGKGPRGSMGGIEGG